MAKEASGYHVSVEGQYFVVAGEKKKTLKEYSIVVNLPTMDSALSVIKNKLLDIVLPKKYPDYAGYRTHHIVDVQPFGNVVQAKAELWQMNRVTIHSYIAENELPVNTDIYDSLLELRQAVEMCEADQDNFLRVQAQKEEEYKLMSSIRDLNPELFSKDDERLPDKEDALSTPVNPLNSLG